VKLLLLLWWLLWLRLLLLLGWSAMSRVVENLLGFVDILSLLYFLLIRKQAL